MASIIIFISLVVLVMNVNCGGSLQQQPKLLVVSYDAFRYDYFDRNLTPFMKHLKQRGTHVDYMMNIFVTKTFPNHHTMATGLYAENHGVVDNEFFDPVSGNVTKYSYQLFHYDNNVLPIWTINEKNGGGRHSGTMMWPGSIYDYQGVSPTFAQAFNETVPWEDRVDTLISWFTHPKTPINFGIMYIEEPDYHGHAIGINGPAFDEILRKIDRVTEYLHRRLVENGLDDINIVHLSDHGMASVTLDRVIDLTQYINSSDYESAGTSTGLHIYPKPGKEETVYDNLKAAAEESKTFEVYKKEDIPRKYHYGNNPRVGPIFVVAKVGYAFQNLLANIEYYKKVFNITVDSKSEFGLHGYDNEAVEMHPIFFAQGPAFIPECQLSPFNNTDLFPLFCEILELDCPRTNGTLTHLRKCLRKEARNMPIVTYQIIFVATTLVITIVGIIIAGTMFCMKKRRRGLRSSYKKSYYVLDG